MFMLKRSLIKLASPLVVVLALVALTVISTRDAQAFTGSGTGTTQDPYMISTCDDLQSIATDAQNDETEGKVYKLGGDINCSATSGWNSGDGFSPIHPFNGTFDGNNHTIDGLTINRPNQDTVGLFGVAQDSSLIMRFNLTNLSVIGRSAVGGVAAEMNGETMGISVSGSVTGASSQYYHGVGGVFARKGNSQNNISRVSFTGSVTNTGPSTGGLVGFGGNLGKVNNVYVNATVTGQNYVGGLMGYTSACCNMVSNGYAAGSVTGNNSVGGLYGYYYDANQDNSINNLFAAVEINSTGTNGAAFGRLSNVSTVPITNVAFDQTVAGTADCYGASDVVNMTCTARNTDGSENDYFYDASNQPLASWDFEDIWSTQVSDYPTLDNVETLTGPGVVSNIEASFPDAPNQTVITFDEPSDTGSFPVKEYELEHIKAGGDWNSPLDSTTESGPLFDIGGLDLETDYTVRIRAITAYGASEWVEYVFTTDAPTTHTINTCAELQDIDQNTFHLDTIMLNQDIDCSGIENFEPLYWDSDFGGTFDGQGHTISNLTIDYSETTGLFGATDGGEIKNLTLNGGSVNAEYGYAGALVGQIEETNLTNVHSNLSVTSTDGNYVGGLVGYARNSDANLDMIFENVSSTGVVSALEYVGGLIGNLEVDSGKSITIKESYSTGDVNGSSDQSWYGNVGGFIGEAGVGAYDDDLTSSLTIQDSYATGTVTGASNLGGFVGYLGVDSDGYDNASANAEIKNSYAAGDVAGVSERVGGFIGVTDSINYETDSTVFSNNFSAGTVTAPDGADAGGFAGYIDAGDQEVVSTGNFYDSSTRENCEGQNGAPLDNCEGIDEDQDPGYFINNSTNAPLDTWDFETIWETQSDDYPKLRAHAGGAEEDLNGDGTPDSQQSNLSGYTSPITGKTVVIDTGENCEITTDDILRESQLAVQDAGYDYANGLFDFAADCQGASTTIKLYYYDVSITNLVARKYNSNTNSYFTIPGVSLSQQTINGYSVAVVTYDIIDGGTLDMDGEVNGSIEDPAGIGTLVVGAPNTGIGGRR